MKTLGNKKRMVFVSGSRGDAFAFARGMSTVVDIAGSCFHRHRRTISYRTGGVVTLSDVEAVDRDWKIVGSDLRQAARSMLGDSPLIRNR
jgi:hypothetical protein